MSRLPESARHLADSILYSYAQILFSNRRWSGALLLAATFFSPHIGLMGLAGGILSNLLAYALRYDPGRIRSGFYGFNGILLAAALGYFYGFSPLILMLFPILVVITFFVAAALENHLAVGFNLPGLSLPFVLALYVSMVFLKNYGDLTHSMLAPSVPAYLRSLPAGVQHYFSGLGLIFLQRNAAAGVLIAIAILLFSRVQFVLTAVGFAASSLFLSLLLPQKADALVVLTGFNSMLTAVALGGSLMIPSRKSLLLALASVLMVVVFAGFFLQLSLLANLPALVLPFNAITLATLYSLKFRQKSSGLVLLYFAPGTPEENYYDHHSRQARFDRLKRFMPDVPFHGEWTVSQGHDGDLTHKDKWRHAWDFVVTDESGQTFGGEGKELPDYHCYRLPIIAALDGEVSLVVDTIPNNRIGEVNLAQNWGNTIVLSHGEGLFSAMSHLEPGSARVKAGDRVRRGEALALCGNSGRSPEPHLHFQFQATDKLGDRTLAYPFGYFIERQETGLALRTAEFPSPGSRIQNVTEHRAVRDAFALKFGAKLAFACAFEGKKAGREWWEVKADAYDTLYIESSAGATAPFFCNDRVMYFSNFNGNRRSALYYFYLSALQVPLTFQRGLTWKDDYPLSKVFHSSLRYLSEPFLFFGCPLRAEGTFTFDQESNGSRELILKCVTAVRGRGFFSAVHQGGSGRVTVHEDGGIAHLEFSEDGQRTFTARCVS